MPFIKNQYLFVFQSEMELEKNGSTLMYYCIESPKFCLHWQKKKYLLPQYTVMAKKNETNRTKIN